MRQRSQRAVFLDRDGVLNELVARDGHWYSPRRFEEFRFIEGTAVAVERLRALGLAVFVVTNQPDIARGLMDSSELDRMTDEVQRKLAPDAVLVCPHDDSDRCLCRKPLPGMLTTLAERWQIDMGASFMVGDSPKDMAAGRAAGCRTIFIDRSGAGCALADHAVTSLAGAADIIAQSVSTFTTPSRT